MKDFKLYTQFNFAKCVHLSLLSVPEGNLCSSPEGILDFIKPYLQELQENTIIPDYLTLVSIQIIDNQDAGVHILTFTINDPEACFGQAPKVNEFENLYTVTVPFTC